MVHRQFEKLELQKRLGGYIRAKAKDWLNKKNLDWIAGKFIGIMQDGLKHLRRAE